MSDVPQYSPSTVEVLDLVARLVRGDEAGWAAFDARFREVVVGAGRKAGLREHDAEDLYQDVAVKLPGVLHQYVPKPTGAGGFRPWLLEMARNMAHDFFRRRANREGWVAVPDEAAAATGVATAVATELDRRALAAALDRLLLARFEKAWVVPGWRLFWLDRLTPEEIAARLGLTYDAVARTLHRVKDYLADNDEFRRLVAPPE